MKKIIVLLLTSLTVLMLLTGCGCKKKDVEKKEEDVKVNLNEDVIKDQQLEVFTFTKTSLIYENGNSYLETLVTNTSNEIQYLQEFKIYVKDIDGAEIVTLTGFVGDSIEANSSKIITSTYGADLTQAFSIEYEIIR